MRTMPFNHLIDLDDDGSVFRIFSYGCVTIIEKNARRAYYFFFVCFCFRIAKYAAHIKFALDTNRLNCRRIEWMYKKRVAVEYHNPIKMQTNTYSNYFRSELVYFCNRQIMFICTCCVFVFVGLVWHPLSLARLWLLAHKFAHSIYYKCRWEHTHITNYIRLNRSFVKQYTWI